VYPVIKLTVHRSVEAALQKAFPKPAAAAKRALAKYISVVESMLFDALQRGQTPGQRKLGLYAVSLEVVWVCDCYREEGNVIRIISARKATMHESK
jgi:uncharacterized DUF497 family protein